MLTTDEKKAFEKIKNRFIERYRNATGSSNIAARGQFEIQKEIISLWQRPNEGIAEYVRTAEKLSKCVPQELDNMLALRLIKGMRDEAKKDDMSYVVHSQLKITFREVIDGIKAKHRIIGKADPFTTTYIGAGRHRQGSGNANNEGINAQVPYFSGNHNPGDMQAMNPQPTAAAARTVPSYHIAQNTMGSTNQEMGRENNTMQNGRATTEHHTGGITEERLFAIMDRYLQARAGNSAQEPNAARIDFRQPAPLTQ